MGTAHLMTLVCAILVMILRTNATSHLIVVSQIILGTYDLINTYHQ